MQAMRRVEQLCFVACWLSVRFTLVGALRKFLLQPFQQMSLVVYCGAAHQPE